MKQVNHPSNQMSLFTLWSPSPSCKEKINWKDVKWCTQNHTVNKWYGWSLDKAIWFRFISLATTLGTFLNQVGLCPLLLAPGISCPLSDALCWHFIVLATMSPTLRYLFLMNSLPSRKQSWNSHVNGDTWCFSVKLFTQSLHWDSQHTGSTIGELL